MAKPPSSPHHSDLDGVHEDGRSNAAGAGRSGEGAEPLERARKGSAGRPPRSDDQPARDDRTG